MKKTAAILLMIFYLIPALGFSITTHFCAGELTNVSFYSDDATQFICGSDKISSDCCKTNTTIVKIKDTQSKDVFTEINFVKSLTKFFFSYPSSIISINQVTNTDFSSFGSPPELSIDDPIYILNNVFRI